MQKFNKATAAVLAGAVVTALGALTALDAETLGAIQTLSTGLLVLFIPNREI